MDRNRLESAIVDEELTKELPFVKKAGAAVSVGIVAAVAVCAVGVYAMFGGKNIPVNDEDNAAVSQTTTTAVQAEETATAAVSQAEATWKKAGIEEYDLVLETVKATEVTSTVAEEKETEAETTTAKKTTAKAAATTASEAEKETQDSSEADDEEDAQEVTSCSDKTRYTSEKVNMREEPSIDGELITVIMADEKITVTGYTDDWYQIKYDGETGYCMKKYTTKEEPESEEVEEEEETQTSVISYTDTEFDMLCCVLQGEVGNCSESSKIAVANVIINRVKSSSFPNTIEGVLTQANQFTAVKGYYNGTSTPSQNTIDCAERALAGEDNTNGAVYYYAVNYCSSSSAAWFETLTFCMEIDGQRFFK